MADTKFHLHVLCKTDVSARDWEAKQSFYRDLHVHPVLTVSAIETIRQIAASAERPFLVCRDTIHLGGGISTHAELLTEELNQRFPNWGLCGNRGMRWDGKRLHDYSYDMLAGGLQTALCAHPVIFVDDALLLANPSVLNLHTVLA